MYCSELYEEKVMKIMKNVLLLLSQVMLSLLRRLRDSS